MEIKLFLDSCCLPKQFYHVKMILDKYHKPQMILDAVAAAQAVRLGTRGGGTQSGEGGGEGQIEEMCLLTAWSHMA